MDRSNQCCCAVIAVTEFMFPRRGEFNSDLTPQGRMLNEEVFWCQIISIFTDLRICSVENLESCGPRT